MTFLTKPTILAQSSESTELRKDIIYLGRMEQVKDPLRFVEIVKEIRNKIPEITGYMIGTGSLEKEVKSKIKQLNLTKMA